MIHRWRTWLAAGAVAATGSAAFGARPFTVDDAGTVAAARFEVETGFDFQDSFPGFSIGLKHGVTPRMDVGIGFSWGINPEIEPVPDMSGAVLGFKYALIADWLSAAFATEFRERAFAVNGIVSHRFGHLEMAGNVGYAVAETTVTLGGLVVYSLFDRLNIGVEANGDKEGLEAWLVGVNFALMSALQVDCGFTSDFALATKAITVGVHVEF